MILICSTEVATSTQIIDKPGDILIFVDSILQEASRTKCLDKRIVFIFDPNN